MAAANYHPRILSPKYGFSFAVKRPSLDPKVYLRAACRTTAHSYLSTFLDMNNIINKMRTLLV